MAIAAAEYQWELRAACGGHTLKYDPFEKEDRYYFIAEYCDECPVMELCHREKERRGFTDGVWGGVFYKQGSPLL